MTGSTTWSTELRGRWDELLQEYRHSLRGELSGLSQEQARRRLVPSKTTLLGLVKHVTYVEAVWFDRAVTGAPLADLGVASSPGRSFTLAKSDTIESVLEAHRAQCQASDRNLAGLALDDQVTGDGTRMVWALYVQVLRELAHHSGHADILREQVLAQNDEPSVPVSRG